MNRPRSWRRVASGLAALVIVGSGPLAATPAGAADVTSSPAAASLVAGDPLPTRPARTPAGEPRGKVVSRITLSIREEPTSHSAYLGGLRPGTVIPLFCKVRGENVDGNNLWYLLGDARPGYVAARYVENQSPVPYCRR
ncbi:MULTISPECIES: SH3 domain-containing protein [unclassified Streptomyces]|uniref:SH3 domain-containing protein n=1 Tax=unclassified Streptomyces TaxID=2593676 RepID=UPI00341AA3B3